MIATIRQTIILLAALAALAACSGDDEGLEYVERSVYEIYSVAVEFLDNGEYRNAALMFDEVERQHPYSIWATKAKLMSAYAYYQSNKYEEAVASADRFITLHPGNRDVAYAYYLKALCYYEQISDVQRDQEMTELALSALDDVINRFSGSPYARDARLKKELTRDHLAGKEMTVGRFYLTRSHYLSAIGRFRKVVDDYGDTTHVPEALHRLTESYTALGLLDEARKTAAVLGYNYPGSRWYQRSYKLAMDPGASATGESTDESPWYWPF